MSQSIIPDEPDDIEVALIAVAYDIVQRLDSANEFTNVGQFIDAFREAYNGLYEVVFEYDLFEFDDDEDEDEEDEDDEDMDEEAMEGKTTEG